jgi:hypothetical protein
MEFNSKVPNWALVLSVCQTPSYSVCLLKRVGVSRIVEYHMSVNGAFLHCRFSKGFLLNVNVTFELQYHQL